MATIADELRRWVAAARGALEWHLETGDGDLPVPPGFAPPPLGQIAPADVLPPAPVDGGQAPSRPASPRGLRALAEAAGAVVGEARASRGEAQTVSRVTPPTPPPDAQPRPTAPQTHAPETEVATAPALAETGETVSRLTPGAFEQVPGTSPSLPNTTSVPAEPPPLAVPTEGRPGAAAALRVLRDEIGPCTRCSLSRGRSELVFGAGDPRARLMLVGERPEQHEDQIGLPFADEAGALLGKMVRAMGLRRSDVWLTYLVNCYDPDQQADVGLDACAPFLTREIEIVQPEVIIALGTLPAWRLTGTAGQQLPHLRGAWHSYRGGEGEIPVRVTFPPRALIQHPESKRQVWTDLKHVMRRMGLGRSR